MPSVNSKPFPIQKLPELAFEAVVRQMINKQRLSLAVTSKKTLNLLLALKFPKDQAHTIHFEKDSYGFMALIIVKDHGVEKARKIHFGCDFYKRGRKIEWADNVFEDWSPVSGSYVEKAQSAYQKIRKLFPACELTLRFVNSQPEDVLQILNAPEFKTWNEVNVYEVMTPEAIKLIMDKASLQRRIIFHSSLELPLDFYHPKAFDFKVAQYSRAKWATVGQLLSIRGVEMIGLGQTSLRSGDVRVVLKKMLETDYQMCGRLEISVTGGYDQEEMMGDTLRFSVWNGEESTTFATTVVQMNTKIAEINVFRNLVRICTSSNEDDHKEARRMLTNLRNIIRIDNQLEMAKPGEKRRLQKERVNFNGDLQDALNAFMANRRRHIGNFEFPRLFI
ncbi:hypothetical protein CRE_20031 [Caenorhabditis remanei]|uniref:F-box domain-containing protein n=1 Tax=Caenorhabditis remanei TaxID=31234 RepID=E3NFE5_CAERE|nr:hypothetical protein CRE_20031 [Caenorhabditis remanei]